MRTAILSNIHGNDVAFEAVHKDLMVRGVNNVIFLGDLVATGPQPLEVYNRLTLLNPLVRIKGITDAWLDDALIDILPTSKEKIRQLDYYDYMTHHLTGAIMDDVMSFDRTKVIQLGHFQVLCVHGSPSKPQEAIDVRDKTSLEAQVSGVRSSVILSGHTHGPHDFTHRIYRMLNPGAVGMCNSDNDSRAHYMMIDTTDGFHVEQIKIKYDIEQVLNIARERKFPNLDDYESKLTC